MNGITARTDLDYAVDQIDDLNYDDNIYTCVEHSNYATEGCLESLCAVVDQLDYGRVVVVMPPLVFLRLEGDVLGCFFFEGAE